MTQSTTLDRISGGSSVRDILKGGALSGAYRGVRGINVFLFAALVLWTYAMGDHAIAQQWRDHGLSSDFGTQIPYFWHRSEIIRTSVAGLAGLWALDAMYSTFHNRGVPLVTMLVVIVIFVALSFVALVLPGLSNRPAADFALLNAELMFAAGIMLTIYCVRFFRGLFVGARGVGAWFRRFFTNLIRIGLALCLAVAFASYDGAIFLALAGLFTGIWLLLRKPAEQKA